MVKVKEKEKESKKEAVKCKDIPKNIVLQRCGIVEEKSACLLQTVEHTVRWLTTIYTSCAGFGFLCVSTLVSKGPNLAILSRNSAGGTGISLLTWSNKAKQRDGKH